MELYGEVYDSKIAYHSTISDYLNPDHCKERIDYYLIHTPVYKINYQINTWCPLTHTGNNGKFFMGTVTTDVGLIERGIEKWNRRDEKVLDYYDLNELDNKEG